MKTNVYDIKRDRDHIVVLKYGKMIGTADNMKEALEIIEEDETNND